MRLSLIYAFIFTVCLMGCYWVFNSNYNPENLIIGKWGELSWEYDKADAADSNQLAGKVISEDTKHLIGENLIIHKKEQWEFRPDGTLLLRGNGIIDKTKWKIKGRGHILQIVHEDSRIENYNIIKVSKDNLVLNFEVNIEVRGIAKLTFSKLRS